MKLTSIIFTVLGLFQFTTPEDKTQNNWIELKEGQSIDGYTKKNNQIYCGETKCNAKPMSGVDVTTFRICPGSQYAKDKNYVYYPINIICIDYTDCGVCYCDKYIIKNVDVHNFTYLEKDYATDKKKVFFRGEEILQADGKTFKVISGPEYFYFAIDKNKVYKHETIFPNADPNTFYYDSTNENNNPELYIFIIADKLNKWKFTPPHDIKPL